MTDEQYQEEDQVGYYDDNGQYQYYEQQQQTQEQWYGDGSSAPASPTHHQHYGGGSPTPSQWEIAYDDDNNPYYFNHTTSEWQYELPVDYVDPYAVDTSTTAATSPTHEEELGYWDEYGEYVYYETAATATTDYLNDDNVAAEDGTMAETSGFTDSQGWQAVDDGYGNVYYYNNYTQEQQWEAPETYTTELNAQAWYNQSVETAAVAFQGKDVKTAAIIRIQSLFRRRAAKRRVIRKRELHVGLKAMHASALVDESKNDNDNKDKEHETVDDEQVSKENNAAIKMQTLMRKRTAMRRAKDMRELSPLLKRIQDCVDAHRLLYGSPIDSINDLFVKIDQDGDGIITTTEICDALERLDVGLTEIQKNKLHRMVDVDENGTIDAVFIAANYTTKALNKETRMKAIKRGGRIPKSNNPDNAFTLHEFLEGICRLGIVLYDENEEMTNTERVHRLLDYYIIPLARSVTGDWDLFQDIESKLVQIEYHKRMPELESKFTQFCLRKKKNIKKMYLKLEQFISMIESTGLLTSSDVLVNASATHRMVRESFVWSQRKDTQDHHSVNKEEESLIQMSFTEFLESLALLAHRIFSTHPEFTHATGSHAEHLAEQLRAFLDILLAERREQVIKSKK